MDRTTNLKQSTPFVSLRCSVLIRSGPHLHPHSLRALAMGERCGVGEISVRLILCSPSPLFFSCIATAIAVCGVFAGVVGRLKGSCWTAVFLWDSLAGDSMTLTKRVTCCEAHLL